MHHKPLNQLKTISSLDFLKQVYRYQTIDSTNEEAKRLLKRKKLDDYTLLLANEQTSGQGRFKRAWFSPPGGLYFSLVIKKTFSPQGLSLMVGMTIAQAFKKTLNQKVFIKWPNDLISQGEKLAGILIEIVDENIIIGCGINTFSESYIKDVNLPDIVTYHLKDEQRDNLLYVILDHLQKDLKVFEREGFIPFKETWKKHAFCLGKTLMFSSPEGSFMGLVMDITDEGGLVIKKDQDIRVYFSGEISLSEIDGEI
ncbi:biotin--[acetyl-CoA-carboxylase] ligase [bacterium]|nr:biotin--[acetyl-CoA-carboxylase] ligase [bacterium]